MKGVTLELSLKIANVRTGALILTWPRFSTTKMTTFARVIHLLPIFYPVLICVTIIAVFILEDV